MTAQTISLSLSDNLPGWFDKLATNGVIQFVPSKVIPDESGRSEVANCCCYMIGLGRISID